MFLAFLVSSHRSKKRQGGTLCIPPPPPGQLGLMDSRVPDKIQALIKKIIPPKGIKRKDIEGAELLDFCC